jgi:hypothetical protein
VIQRQEVANIFAPVAENWAVLHDQLQHLRDLRRLEDNTIVEQSS